MGRGRPDGQVQAIQEEGDSSGSKNEVETEDIPEEEQGEISLCVAMGVTSSSSKTIKIQEYVKKLPITILIDCGFTHSFVNSKIVKVLRLEAIPSYAPMKVKVANGEYMYSRAICPNFCWKMQEEPFCFDVRLLQVGGCELVLGIDWLDLVAPVLLHTRPLSISFFRGDTWVTLLSHQEDPKLVTT